MLKVPARRITELRRQLRGQIGKPWDGVDVNGSGAVDVLR